MTIRQLIILTVFIPTVSFGQSKYCNSVYSPATVIPCTLTAYKKVDDTLFSTAPTKCNTFLFDSTANGQWKIYSADTTTLLEIISIKNGKRHGINIDFYSNGQIQSKAEYKNGKLNGEYITFFETGKINWKGYFKNDDFTGTETDYWDNGNVASQTTFKNGNAPYDKTKYWDKDGKVIDRQKFNKLWYDCK